MNSECPFRRDAITLTCFLLPFGSPVAPHVRPQLSSEHELALSSIRAVLFDVDGTLYVQSPLRIAMAGEMAIASAVTAFSRGIRVPTVIATFRRVREQLRGEHEGHEFIATRQYSVVAERLRCSADEVEQIVEEWMSRRPLKWLRYCRRRGLVRLLDCLARRGIVAGVLSDYPAQDKLAALGVSRHFDLVLTTADPAINAFKPSERGYLAAAAKWHLKPSEVLYVGDRVDVDVPGARAAGMLPAVLTRRQVDQDVIAIRTFAELTSVFERPR